MVKMEEKKGSQNDGKYPSQDVDFGVFRPMSETSSQFPCYPTWTQFSGMPAPPSNSNNYTWDSFVTPPPTPSSANIEFDMQNPNFFSNFSNVMQGMGRTDPADFDADTRSADNANLASTPVAQSLLEALSSPNLLASQMTDGTLPLQEPFNYQDTSQDGFEMYNEALKTLGSPPCGSFSPFGTPDVLSSSPASSTPTKELESQSSANNLKPSYSEVAKTLKSNQSAGKDDSDLTKKRTDSTTSRSFKGNKKYVSRPIRGRNNSMPNDMRPTVSPGSKYGLDDFGDLEDEKGDKEECYSSMDSIPSIARKNSTSSLSSGTSGIEEIHLSKTNNFGSNTSESSPNVEKIVFSKDKEKAFDEKIHNVKDEKQFFDARRIFQSKDTNKRRSGQSKLNDDNCGPEILNNGKPSYAAWCSTNAPKKSTHYINNNLRDSGKKTNQNPTGGHKGQTSEHNYPQTNGRTEKLRSRSSSSKSEPAAASNAKPNMPLQTAFDQEIIDEWLSFLYDKAKLCLHQLWTLVLMIILLIFSIIVYLVSSCVHILSWIWGKVWTFLVTKVFRGRFFSDSKWKKKIPDFPKKIGLEENIGLPSTGDEAMQRLLAGKGKDPYSILGLKGAATDDDIKKYYRRQAVLVHPDKNQQPGAEEAFKILGHAFDLIGDAAKRQAYDRQLHEATEAEAAMREFNDLLSKLQEKIQKASNMMRCDNCGGKHKRVPVERPWYSARFCDRCSIRHSAKEGDVWAETSMLGFLWHYYACMEGKVFDITEWVACKKDFFKHMQANAHHVFYRIATEGNRGHHGKNNGGTGGNNGTGSEADLEDFISNLFHQAMSSDGSANSGAGTAGNSQSWQQHKQSNGQSWNAPGTTGSTNTSQGKKSRRRKKKH